jgi:cytochrome P450
LRSDFLNAYATNSVILLLASTVFMGAEVANNPEVLETFVMSMHDFANVMGLNDLDLPFWRRWLNLKLNYFNNPLKRRVQILAKAATPVILERRQREAQLINEGADAPEFLKQRPHDILQKMLDRFDEYGFIDLEDICGHIMLLILTSVHTTIDASTAMVYYLAAYPETILVLHREQVQVLDAIQQERQQERSSRLEKGLEVNVDLLDPAHDRDLTSAALKRMIHLESFQREVLRCRTEALTHFHMARKETLLSNGMVIPTYSMMLANLTSTHANNSAAHGPNPGEFQPWRYVGTHKTMTKVGVDYLPFGMGKHVCPGRFMASQQSKTLVSLIVSKFEKIAFHDPSQAAHVLRTQYGDVSKPALVFTSRE